MAEKWTGFIDYFRKVPAAFLVAIVFVLGLILFLPEEYAKALFVDGFRNKFGVFLGPAFLLILSFCAARIFDFFMQRHRQEQSIEKKQEALHSQRMEVLHSLTPEEKGYLVPYIQDQCNTIKVGIDDGVMGGLCSKGITYRAANMGSVLYGFAFNLQPWAREYLEKNRHLLDGSAGSPMTPSQKLDAELWR